MIKENYTTKTENIREDETDSSNHVANKERVAIIQDRQDPHPGEGKRRRH